MKIAFVISSLTSGGAERVASLLANKWSEKNEIRFFLTSLKMNQSYPISSKISVHYLSENYLSPFQKTKLLKMKLRQYKPDIVVSFIDPCNFYAVRACKSLNIPVVCSERSAPQKIPDNKILRILRNWSFSHADAVVFQTEEAKRFFSKKIRRKGSIISNPAPAKPLYERKFANLDNTIISAGRLNAQKDYGTLILAFDKFAKVYPNYQLHIYGSGPEKENLNSLILNLGLSDKIYLKGFSEDMMSVYEKAKIYVLSSIHEGIPNALLEALVAGVPAISTDCPVGGPKQLLEHNQYSLLVPVGSIDGIYDALCQISANYDHYFSGALCESDKILLLYGLDQISKKWLSLFEELIRSRSHNK